MSTGVWPYTPTCICVYFCACVYVSTYVCLRVCMPTCVGARAHITCLCVVYVCLERRRMQCRPIRTCTYNTNTHVSLCVYVCVCGVGCLCVRVCIRLQHQYT